MKLRLIAVIIAMILLVPDARAAKSEFTISITTTNTTLPFEQYVAEPQPGTGQERHIAFTLTSPEKPLPTAIAEVWIPESLGQGRKVGLVVKQEPQAPPAVVAVETLKLNVFWGSSPAVKSGQPKVLTWKDFPEPVRKAMKPENNSSGESVAECIIDPKKLPENVQLAGDYRLMSYAGNVTLALDPDQTFLPSLTAGLKGDTGAPGVTEVSWQPVKGALAYFVTAHAAASDDTMVAWTSGEGADAAKDAGVDSCLSDKQINSLITKRILLGPGETKVTIPSGIFGDADAAMIVVTAYGRDKASSSGNVKASAIIRSTATMIHELKDKPGSDN